MSDAPVQLSDLVKSLREERGWSQTDLASRVGVSQQAIQQLEKGEVTNPRYLANLAAAFEKPIDVFAFASGSSVAAEAINRRHQEARRRVETELKVRMEQETRQIEEIRAAAARREAPQLLYGPVPLHLGSKDLPIYASAQGGPDGMIISFDAVEHVRRPEPLANVTRGFGMYVVGESMEPVYNQGDMILCHPTLPARLNDDVLIVKQAQPDNTHFALIKRYVRGDNDRIVVKQFNPAEQFEVSRAELAGLYVVVGKYNRR